MLGSVMMTEKIRVTTNHHATGGSLGRSTVRAQPAKRTGWWIPVTALVAWLVYRQIDAATAVEAALVGVAVFIALLGFSMVRAAAHRWWGGTSRAARPIGDSR
jgi:cobalamin synthase